MLIGCASVYLLEVYAVVAGSAPQLKHEKLYGMKS